MRPLRKNFGRCGGAVVAVSLALALSLGPARADAQVSASDRETARSLMEQGDAKANASDYAGALKLYQGALALVPVPSIAFQVAKTRVALGQLIAAREDALAVGRMPRSADEPPPFTQARAGAAQLASSLEARIPSIVVAVDGLPAGATPTVRVDGEPLPAASLALPRKVDPGPHVITASADGFAEARQDVVVAEASRRTITITLHGAPTTLRLAPAAPASPVTPLAAYATLGGAGALLGVGAVTGGLSLAQASEAKRDCTGDACTPAAQPHIDSSKRLAWASDITLGLGIVGAAIGGWLAYEATRHPALAALEGVQIGPKSAAATLRWSFR